MITPLDIESKEFKKAMRGYSISDVEHFIDQFKQDYERLYRENIELKDKIKAVSDQLSRYSTMEETLKQTLIVAQQAAEEVSLNAHKKSELIHEEARMSAKKIIEDANDQVIEIKKEYENIRKEAAVFKGRFKSLLQDGMSVIQETFSELDENNV